MRIGSPVGLCKIEIGEADVDGDAAPLLFLQAVGIDAGEGADQCALAMVNVACGADDHCLHGRQCTNLLWNSRSPAGESH